MHGSAVNDLIQQARSVQGTFKLRNPEFTAASVGAALMTGSGAVFTGVSVHLACGIGFCAEHAAVAEMLKQRETKICLIVSVTADGVISPCGRCRELMMQLDAANSETRVVLPGERVMPLRDLTPEHWMAS